MKKLVISLLFILSLLLTGSNVNATKVNQCDVVYDSYLYTYLYQGYEYEYILDNWIITEASQISSAGLNSCKGTVNLISPCSETIELNWKKNLGDNTLTIGDSLAQYDGHNLIIYVVPAGIKTKIGDTVYTTKEKIPTLLFK